MTQTIHTPALGSARFSAALQHAGMAKLSAAAQIHTLQVNVGKYCNQSCQHCHVDAGPTRKEMMSQQTAEQIVAVLRRYPELQTLDITGGAPELHAVFRYLVRSARELNRTVIDRCNLTVLFVEGQEDLAEFLADQRVQIIASLPCYLEQNVDRQRGGGVFKQSLEALRWLNELGYGAEQSGLELHLIYNPVGTGLPPPQAALERDYKTHLAREFGVRFNRLYTLTNMPIARFAQDLLRQGKYEQYLQTLMEKFNPQTVPELMCRSLISVSWDGWLYDCDFNQMLELPLSAAQARHISDFSLEALRGRPIRTADHCLGCTAGAGSSCGGALTTEPQA